MNTMGPHTCPSRRAGLALPFVWPFQLYCGEGAWSLPGVFHLFPPGPCVTSAVVEGPAGPQRAPAGSAHLPASFGKKGAYSPCTAICPVKRPIYLPVLEIALEARFGRFTRRLG